MVEMVEHSKVGVTALNVASGVAWSMQTVLEMIGAIRGRPLPVEADPARMRPTERSHLQADVARLRQFLGWTPHTDLQRRLEELLASEKLRH